MTCGESHQVIRLLLATLLVWQPLGCVDSSESAAHTVLSDGGVNDGPSEGGERCALGWDRVTPLPEQGLTFAHARFLWHQDGLLWVAPGARGKGLQLLRLTDRGELVGEEITVWPETPLDEMELAVHGDVLAVATVTDQGEPSPRPTCRLGLVDLATGASIAEPFLISDPPSGGSILNEARACAVSRDDRGFVVVWPQNTSGNTFHKALFAQRIDLSGRRRGARLSLASSQSKGLNRGASLAWTGESVLVGHVDEADQPALSRIEPSGVSPLSVPLEPSLGIFPEVRWNGALLVRCKDQLAVLDAHGRLLHGPVELAADAQIAPFGTGYVVVRRDEFLVGQLLDGALSELGEPMGISDDRFAGLTTVVGDPRGDAAAVIFGDDGRAQLGVLSCGTQGPPVGPPTCPHQEPVVPLDDGCTEDVCHAVIRLDYPTLGLKGYTLLGGPYQPVSGAGAEGVAREVLTGHGAYLFDPQDPPRATASAGVYALEVREKSFRGLALIGADSGLLLAAGEIRPFGIGWWQLPEEWRSAAELFCGDTPARAVEQLVTVETCAYSSSSYPTAAEALDLALRLNLAATFQARGSFSAAVFLYSRSRDTMPPSCNPGMAEYVVVLSQRNAHAAAGG